MSKLNNRAINLQQVSHQLSDPFQAPKEVEVQSRPSSYMQASHRSSNFDMAPEPQWKSFLEPSSLWRKEQGQKQYFVDRNTSNQPYCALRRKSNVTKDFPQRQIQNKRSGPLQGLLPLKTDYSRNSIINQYQGKARTSIQTIDQIKLKRSRFNSNLLIDKTHTMSTPQKNIVENKKKVPMQPNSSRIAKPSTPMTDQKQIVRQKSLKKLDNKNQKKESMFNMKRDDVSNPVTVAALQTSQYLQNNKARERQLKKKTLLNGRKYTDMAINLNTKIGSLINGSSRQKQNQLSRSVFGSVERTKLSQNDSMIQKAGAIREHKSLAKLTSNKQDTEKQQLQKTADLDLKKNYNSLSNLQLKNNKESFGGNLIVQVANSPVKLNKKLSAIKDLSRNMDTPPLPTHRRMTTHTDEDSTNLQDQLLVLQIQFKELQIELNKQKQLNLAYEKDIKERDWELEQQVKQNAKKEKEIDKLSQRVKQLEKEKLDWECSELKVELPPQLKFPPSVKNAKVKNMFSNHFQPLMNLDSIAADNNNLLIPNSGRRGLNLDEIEASEYESALYVSERIVRQVMKAIDPDEESRFADKVEDVVAAVMNNESVRGLGVLPDETSKSVAEATNDLDQTKIHSKLDPNILELSEKEQLKQFKHEMIELEKELSRELRIHRRKITKYEIYLNETKMSYGDLVEELQKILRPNSTRKMIKEELVQKLKKEIKDQRNEFEIMVKNHVTQKKQKWEEDNSLLDDMDNESMLYLSSNWSTGILEYTPVCETKRIIGNYIGEMDDPERYIQMPKFDIQKAIDYPRSDFDSDSCDEEKEEYATAQQLNAVENRIDQILAQGGLEVDSQGSLNDFDKASEQSDLVPPSQSLARDMDKQFDTNEPLRIRSSVKDLKSDLQSNVDDILKKVDTFIIDEEDPADQLHNFRTSVLSNDPFQNLRTSNLSSDQFHILRSSNVSTSIGKRAIPPATNIIEYCENNEEGYKYHSKNKESKEDGAGDISYQSIRSQDQNALDMDRSSLMEIKLDDSKQYMTQQQHTEEKSMKKLDSSGINFANLDAFLQQEDDDFF